MLKNPDEAESVSRLVQFYNAGKSSVGGYLKRETISSYALKSDVESETANKLEQ